MLSSHENMLPYPPMPMPMPMPMPPLVSSDRRWKPNVELAPNCPRCDSANTKFCYYNNYSLSQPRYFCKACRRYWTKGGSLRNVPVGGGCRKNRRSKPPSARAVSNNNAAAAACYSNCGTAAPPRNLVRPDLALDGAVPADHPVVTGTPAYGAGDGSSIDLALLYAKFLNQCPAENPAAGADEPFDSFAAPYGGIVGSSLTQIQVQLPSPDVFMVAEAEAEAVECSENQHSIIGEVSFSPDPITSCCYETLSLPIINEGVNNSSTVNPTFGFQTFESFPEEYNGLSHMSFINGDWSALDCSGTLEALYRPW